MSFSNDCHLLGPKSCLKMPILMSYELNWANCGLFRLGNSRDGSFFWSLSQETGPEADLKQSRCQKMYLGLQQVNLGSKKGSKIANFCKLQAKFDYLRSIQPRELTWWTIFLDFVMGNVTRVGFKAFQTSEKYVLMLQQVNLGSKKTNFDEL